MHYHYEVILKRWLPILKEYERTKAKVTPRPFKFVKDLCQAHHISAKELRRYYVKWTQGSKSPDSLLPAKRDAKPGSRRTPKEIERNIIKAYRRFGSNRYELVLLLKSLLPQNSLQLKGIPGEKIKTLCYLNTKGMSG